MEWVEGFDPRSGFTSHRLVCESVTLVRCVADALSEPMSEGLCIDIKPANLLLRGAKWSVWCCSTSVSPGEDARHGAHDRDRVPGRYA